MTHKSESRYEVVVQDANGFTSEYGRHTWYSLADARRRAKEEIAAGALVADIYRITYPQFGPSVEKHVQVIHG